MRLLLFHRRYSLDRQRPGLWKTMIRSVFRPDRGKDLNWKRFSTGIPGHGTVFWPLRMSVTIFRFWHRVPQQQRAHDHDPRQRFELARSPRWEGSLRHDNEGYWRVTGQADGGRTDDTVTDVGRTAHDDRHGLL